MKKFTFKNLYNIKIYYNYNIILNKIINMNKQILFLLVLLFVTIASAGHGCPFDEQECSDFCVVHIHSNGVPAKGGKCGGPLWAVCKCTY